MHTIMEFAPSQMPLFWGHGKMRAFFIVIIVIIVIVILDEMLFVNVFSILR